MTSFAERLRTNFDDVLQFGFQFLKRHAPRFTGAPTVLIRAAGQSIHVRAGETDIAAVRSVLGDQQYNISAVIPALDRRINERYEEIKRFGRVPTIVDAGANIGAASLWFKKRYPDAAVVSVEPELGNFSVLEKNSGLANNIIPIQAAIGSEPGFVKVESHAGGWAARVEKASIGLPIITMHDAFRSVSNGCPFIAKIDIEGFEKELFSSNTDWLSAVFVVHIEPHDWMLPGRGASLPFQKAMAQHDFEVFIAGEVLTYVRHVPMVSEN